MYNHVHYVATKTMYIPYGEKVCWGKVWQIIILTVFKHLANKVWRMNRLAKKVITNLDDFSVVNCGPNLPTFTTAKLSLLWYIYV